MAFYKLEKLQIKNINIFKSIAIEVCLEKLFTFIAPAVLNSSRKRKDGTGVPGVWVCLFHTTYVSPDHHVFVFLEFGFVCSIRLTGPCFCVPYDIIIHVFCTLLQALYDFDGQSDEELSFKANDVIQIQSEGIICYGVILFCR